MMLRRRGSEVYYREVRIAVRAVRPVMDAQQKDRLKRRIMASLGEQARVHSPAQARLSYQWVRVPTGVGIAAAVLAAASPLVARLLQDTGSSAVGVFANGSGQSSAIESGRLVVSGESSTVLLRDGFGRVDLEPRTAIRVRYAAGLPSVEIVRGRMVVASAQAGMTVHGAGWRSAVAGFSVVEFEHNEGVTRLAVVEGSVAVRVGDQACEAGPGEAILVGPGPVCVVLPVATPPGQAGSAESRGQPGSKQTGSSMEYETAPPPRPATAPPNPSIPGSLPPAPIVPSQASPGTAPAPGHGAVNPGAGGGESNPPADSHDGHAADGGDGPGSPPGENSGQGSDPAENPGSSPGENSGQGNGPAENPGSPPGENSGQGNGPAENSGSSPGENSGQGSGPAENSGSPPGENSGQGNGPAENPGSPPGENSGQGSGPAEHSGSPPGENSGQGNGPAENPGSPPGENSGQGNGPAENPGSPPGENSGQGSGPTDNLGSPPGENNGQGNGPAENLGSPPSENGGNGKAPGESQGSAPGQNSGQGRGSRGR